MPVTFLQQSLLWGLLAVSIPIIVHLLNRRRFRTVQWAAMDFLLKATRESRGKKKLKYILILTLRALAIAALILAVARPLVGGFLSWGGSQVNTVILILDRSPSMEQIANNSDTSKRLAAIKNVQQSLDRLNNPKLILIDSASATAQAVPSPDALSELSAASATDAKASIPTLISTAIDYISDNSPGRTEIWLASDLQQSDWAPDDGRWEAVRAALIDLPQQATLRIISMASATTDNIAVSVLSATRVQNELSLEIEIIRSESSQISAVPLTYSLNGSRSSETVNFAGQRFRHRKNLVLGDKQGEGYGFVATPTDSNPRDNVSYFAYGEHAPATTYLISEGGEPTTWLALACAPPGLNDNKCKILPPDQTDQIDWSNASLVIWQAILPTNTTANKLNEYLKNGGVVLFLPPRGESESSFLGIQWQNLETSAQDQYFIIEDWNRSDGPLRDGDDGISIPASKLKAIKRRGISGDYTTLATWSDEQPFLIRQVVGDGTAIFTTSLPDYSWSNLADADVLLPIIQRMIRRGDSRFSSAFSAIAGAYETKLAQSEIRTRIDDYAESNSSNAAYEAGVWKLGERLLATNRPASEDEWLVLDTESIKTLLDETQYSLFEDAAKADSLVKEIWKVLLITMLVFLITEALLCLQPKTSNTKIST
ncbi:MAG: BatA domain-containing protein [Akkermansiaceae bacterium]